MRVAVLGTGTMGAGMARSLARAGLDVTAWNRTAERAEPLAADGVVVAATASEAVTGADAVITILYDVESVLAVCPSITATLGTDAVWLQSSTVGPAGMARIADAAHGVPLLDVPVLGTKKPAEEGALVALVSGPEVLVETVRPVLDAISNRTIMVGDALGDASALKLACNAWIATITAATAQSIALAAGLGVPAELFLEAISGAPVDSPYAQLKGKAMLAGDWTTSFAVDGVVKDVQLILDAAAGLAFPAELLDAVRQLFVVASDGGHGGDDMASVRTAFRT